MTVISEDQVLNELRKILVVTKSDSVLLDPESVMLDSQLIGPPLSMDSIDFVSMIIAIEEVFGIVAEDEDFLASSMKTVGDVVQLVVRRLQGP